jgi:malonate-semialdehyde dehydrogenase (acetylating)/methylmalonate-semialdehyde dehydrogenase
MATEVGRAAGPARADAPAPRLANLAGGRWRVPDGEWLEDVDPATGEVAALVPLSGPAEVDAAVAAARATLPEWRETPPQQRARAVLALREALLRNRERLVALVSADMGKTLADADGEVGRGIESVESAAAIPHLLKGETLEGVAAGVDVETVRQPVGVVAAITPFNFPAMIPLWFLPYAIACGNTFVLKPSERDPRPSALIAELAAAVEEIPDGVVNLVHGGREAVEGLLDHDGVDAISFVGQASTARLIASRCVQTGKRVQALGGAKNSLVVMPDADLGTAVPAILASAFGAAGQRCLAGSVCVAVGDEARQDELLAALREGAAGLVTGPGQDAGTDVCPMISAEARARIDEALATAEGDSAADVVLDGRRDPGAAGTMMGPSIVETTDHDSALARDELFGPLLAYVRAPGLDEAIDFVNGSRYGNAGAIFTASGAAARTYRARAEAGMLGVNIGVPAPVAWFPFAGWKDSIDGDLHANGSDAVDFYTRKKVVTSRW